MSREPERPVGRPLELGPLEKQVLDVLWDAGGPLTVRHVHEHFPGLAYTTLMTTLERLHRKALLDRRPRGRAFEYTVRSTRAELVARLTADGLMSLLPDIGSSRPVLSMLVEAVGRRDAALLDELEALVQAERRRHREESAS
jgi:predicted transcriptional regulator